MKSRTKREDEEKCENHEFVKLDVTNVEMNRSEPRS